MLGFVIFSAAIIALGESNRRGIASRGRLAAIIDSSDDAIIGKNLDGVITSWNRAAEKIFEWTASEAIGQPITILIPPELHEEEARILKQLRAGQRLDHFQTIRVTKTGRRIVVSLTISPVKNALGAVVGASKIARDITKSNKAEEASRRNEERLRAAFTQTYSLQAFLAPDGTVVDANRTTVEGCGFTREEVIGRKFWEPWWGSLEHEQLKLKNAIARAAQGEIIREECSYCLRDQTVRFAERTLTPVRGEDGRIELIVAAGIDITEQKDLRDSLEERVTTRTQELERSNTALRELSGRLLRTQDEERRRLARELHDGVGQLLTAVRMNISQVEREKTQLSPAAAKCEEENADLVDQISKEIRTLSYLLHPPLLDEVGLKSAIEWYVEGFVQRSKLAVNLEVPAEFSRLASDVEIALFRVVQECLINIHRHSGSAKAAIRLVRENGNLHLEVKDEGKGIPLEKQLAFNSSGAIGVGLRGMRERIRQLGGVLEVHSNGNGTCVSATLPVELPTAESSETNAVTPD